MGSATTETGQFYTDLATGYLPNFSFITPNLIDDAHGGTAAGDAWLSQIVSLITSSPNYQAGNTVIFITNDEGTGPDYALNENCASQALDASQPSCIIPTIVVAPYVPAGIVDNTPSTLITPCSAARKNSLACRYWDWRPAPTP